MKNQDMKNHLTELFDTKRLRELYRSEKLMDVKLKVGTSGNRTVIKAHRVVLALASPYFYDLFKENEVLYNIYAIDSDSLVSIIGYIYTGSMSITEENVERLYQAAELTDIVAIKDECLEYVIKNVDDSNWDRRLNFARKHNCEDLNDVVISYISNDNKYMKYMATPQFLGLDYEEITTILNAPARLETPEEDIFTSVIRWLKAKEKDRKSWAVKLLKQLDLTSLPEDFVQFHVDREEVLHTFDCLQLYKKAVDSLEKQNKEKIKDKNKSNGTLEDEIYMLPQPDSAHKPRISLSSAEMIHRKPPITIDEGSDLTSPPPQKRSKLAEVNDSSTPVDVTRTSSALETTVSPPKKFTARKKTGGLSCHYARKSAPPDPVNREKQSKSSLKETNQNDVDSVTTCIVTYTPRIEKATAVVPPTQLPVTSNTPTPSTSATATPSTVSAPVPSVGITRERGNSMDSVSNEVVVYLRETDVETRVMMTDLSMKHPKQLRPFYRNNKSPALVWSSCARRLYALGGLSTVVKEAGSSTEVRYTPELNLMKNSDKEKYWMKGPPMIQERSKFKAVVLGDYIYAFGGAEGVAGNEAVNCAERLSVVSKNPKWEEVDFLQRARHGFGAGVIDGKIYVCGGYGATDGSNDAKMGILGTVECYDPVKDEWKFVASMFQERHNLSVAVLNDELYAMGGGGVKSHTDPDADFDNMTSVEKYDPKEDSWTLVGNLNIPRKSGSAVTLNGRLFAIGGDQARGNEKVDPTVEVYSPAEDKWTMFTEKLDPVGDFSTVAVLDK